MLVLVIKAYHDLLSGEESRYAFLNALESVTDENVQKINTFLSTQILFVDGRFATVVPLFQHSYF